MSGLHEFLENEYAAGVEGRIGLCKRFGEIKNDASILLAEYGKNGYGHSERLEGYLDKLTEEALKNKRLLPAEAFILLCAVYLHDLGYKNENGRPQKEGHQKRSKQMILEDPNRYRLGNFAHSEGEIPRVAQAIAEVCYGHSEERFYPLENFPNRFTDQALCGESMNLRKLVAFLRIADEADDPYIRIIGDDHSFIRGHTNLVEIGPESIRWHWENDRRGTYEEFKQHLEEKNVLLRSSIEYLDDLDIGKWDMVLEGGEYPYRPPKYVDNLDEYLNQVLEETKFVNTHGIPLPKDRDGQFIAVSVPLDKVYIKLQAIERERRRALEKEEAKGPFEDAESVAPSRGVLPVIRNLGEYLYRRGEVYEAEDRPEPVDPEDLLEKHKKLVILGAPGAGKSTLLRYLARKAAGKRDGPVPILVSLRDYATTQAYRNPPSLIEFAVDNASCDGKFQQELRREIEAGNVLWLVDALDEARGWALKALEEARHLKGQLVLTSRPAGYEGSGLEEVPHYEILPLKPEDTGKFIEDWYAILAEQKRADQAWIDERSSWLEGQIEERPRIKPLTHNPLMLTFLVIISGEDPQLELPYQRTELYKRYIDRLLRSWESERRPREGAEGELAFVLGRLQGEEAFQAAIDGFYYLGWILHLAYFAGKPEGSPDEDSIANRLSQYTGNLLEGYPKTLAKKILSFWEEAGLLETWHICHEEYLAFRHMTFQEYAAAWGLNELWKMDSNKAWEFLKPRLHHYAWHEPILLLAGMMDKEHLEHLTKLLLKATSENEEILHRDLFLASELIGEQTYSCPTVTKEVIDRLERLYENINWHVRLAATQALRGIGDDRAVEPLIKALGDINSDVRRATAEALGNIGDDRAVEPLIKALGDDDWSMRQVVAQALGNICGDRAVELFKDILKDGKEGMRQVVAQALGGIGGDLAVDLLIDMLKDGDWQARYATIQALGNIGDDRAVELLKDTLADKNSDLRWGATLALGNIGDDRALELLIGALGDEENLVRQMTSRSLGNIGSAIVMEPLMGALWDEDSDVRQEAARALGNIGGEIVIEPLIGTLGNEDCQSRRAAALALGNIGGDRAFEALMDTLVDKDKDVRWAAALALGNIGDDRAVEPLIGMLKDEDWQVRHIASQSLGNIGDDRAVEPLIERLRDDERQVRHIAARALGNICSDRAVELLIETLKDEDYQLRLAAAEALGKTGDDRAVEPLIDKLGDEDWWVCQAAAESLEKLTGSMASLKTIEHISKSAKERYKFCLLRTVTTRLGVMKVEENPAEDPLLEVIRRKK